jgi:hypothetical protein
LQKQGICAISLQLQRQSGGQLDTLRPIAMLFSTYAIFIAAHCCALAAFLVSLSYTQSIDSWEKGTA